MASGTPFLLSESVWNCRQFSQPEEERNTPTGRSPAYLLHLQFPLGTHCVDDRINLKQPTEAIVDSGEQGCFWLSKHLSEAVLIASLWSFFHYSVSSCEIWYPVKSHNCVSHLPTRFLISVSRLCPSSFLIPLVIFLSVLLFFPLCVPFSCALIWENITIFHSIHDECILILSVAFSTEFNELI